MKATTITKQTGIASISKVCACFNLKRDAYYKYQQRWKRCKSIESRVIQLVKEERKELPRVGVRKLYEALQPSFEAAHIKIGRDSLFDMLRANNMLVKRKRAYAKITNSYHHFHKYNNLIKDVKIYYKSGLTPAQVMDLIPVKPIGENEAEFKTTLNTKLIGLFEKIKRSKW